MNFLSQVLVTLLAHRETPETLVLYSFGPRKFMPPILCIVTENASILITQAGVNEILFLPMISYQVS